MAFYEVICALMVLKLKQQIWSLGSPDPNFTLDGHQKGVNCVDYFTGGDRPYLITGSDDSTAKVFFFLSTFECSKYPRFCAVLRWCGHGEPGLGLPNEELCSDT